MTYFPRVQSDSAGIEVIASTVLATDPSWTTQSTWTELAGYSSVTWFVEVTATATSAELVFRIEWAQAAVPGSGDEAEQFTEAITAGVGTESVYRPTVTLDGTKTYRITVPVSGPRARVSVQVDAGTTTATTYVTRQV